MKTLEEILETRTARPEEMLNLYDSLALATLDYMMGRWEGFEIATGHPLDGLLVPSGWYGKVFVNPEEVHPLVFFGDNKKELFALNPKHLPLTMQLPKSDILGTMMKIARPFLQTKKSKARLRMVAHRNKLTATMIYDDKAIYDHFAIIDDHTVLGCMDLKGVAAPYFWVMKRDDHSDYKILF